ncbi:LytR C-terminal domain-containing protein [Nocardioides marmoribigeumensis]|uniref:LytR/CpsA/Psr regulator C-terminal domain-containing protein n=1 Tax=Nocardioides marmoribigeumensis TaxID=433649 RepID=A0ABU2BVN0_9ACTN|nr:LytR C-terminal domain-containing protein [Nocardioides marmoribigeumensis]MDR7362694.1 hypothetical protein [Nocardioides marmoribigeumensis]
MNRRSGLAGITFLVLFGILAVGVVVGWHAVSEPVPSLTQEEPSAGPSCNAGLAPGDVVRTGDVTVSVFNAGNRSGLADQTLGQLTARGFLAGDVGNAPADAANVKFVRVLAPSKNDPAAQLVARQFGPQTLVQPTRTDLGPGVDVIVGDRFVGLAKAPRQLKAKAAGSGC